MSKSMSKSQKITVSSKRAAEATHHLHTTYTLIILPAHMRSKWSRCISEGSPIGPHEIPQDPTRNLDMHLLLLVVRLFTHLLTTVIS